MHRCHVPHAAGSSVVLTSDQAHHLTHVLRLGIGASLIVFDGGGREWLGTLTSVGRHAVVELVESRVPVAEPTIHVTLAVAVLKGDQMDTVVRDATALGAAVIAPFQSSHVAVSGGRNFGAARDRWTRVAVASAMQCGRAVVPELLDVTSFDAALDRAKAGAIIVCVEPAHANADVRVTATRPNQATVFIGPEGGWSADELARARTAGAELLTLGPRTLRAELAPTVALATLWERWTRDKTGSS